MSYFSRILDTNGDGTGVRNAIGDYSSAPQDFFGRPPENGIAHVYRLLVFIRDVGALDTTFYGNDIVLINGIRVFYTSRSGTRELTGGIPVMNNADWSKYCHDITPSTLSVGVGGQSFMSARWTFSRAGQPLELKGPENNITVRLNDDFSGLVEHYFIAQGVFLGRV